jgi:glyoxylase-like metal-dependent hydrolase (beta-lactamase superfamily II)
VRETVLAGISPAYLYPDLEIETLTAHERELLLSATDTPVALSIHTWLVELDGKRILIDTGIGNDKDRPFSTLFHRLRNPFLERLEAVGADADKIDYVLTTHLHVDHVGWNTHRVAGQWVPTFPKARYAFAQAELDFFATPQGEARRMVFEDSVAPVIAAGQAEVIGLAGGRFLDVFTFHPTNGHSAGHMSIGLEVDSEKALFTGDVMHNPVQVLRPEWNSVFCLEPEVARRSRAWLLAQAAEQDLTLFTAHFPQTSAGKVTRTAHGYDWRYV